MSMLSVCWMRTRVPHSDVFPCNSLLLGWMLGDLNTVTTLERNFSFIHFISPCCWLPFFAKLMTKNGWLVILSLCRKDLEKKNVATFILEPWDKKTDTSTNTPAFIYKKTKPANPRLSLTVAFLFYGYCQKSKNSGLLFGNCPWCLFIDHTRKVVSLLINHISFFDLKLH